jgi:hypothetical protein
MSEPDTSNKFFFALILAGDSPLVFLRNVLQKKSSSGYSQFLYSLSSVELDRYNRLAGIGTSLKRHENRVLTESLEGGDKINNSNRSTDNSEDNNRERDIRSRLTKLKKLLDAGLIAKEEAAEKRKAILDSL